MKTLKVGVVGAGMIGSLHVEAIRRIPGAEVIAIADSTLQVAQEKAAQLAIAHAYKDGMDLIINGGLGVIHICTPNASHFDLTRLAMECGIAVYSEKPLAADLKDGRALVKLEQETGIRCGVNFQYRSNAMVQEMRCRVGQTSGRPFLVHGHYLQDWLMYDNDYNWRIEETRAGGARAVADIGSHWFDLVQHVLNSRITSVFADLICVHPERKKPACSTETFRMGKEDLPFETVPVSSDDAGFILVKFQNGVHGALTLSQVSAGCKNALELSVDCDKEALQWRQEEADRLWIGSRMGGSRLLLAAPDALSEPAQRFALLPAGHSVAWNDALRNNIAEFYRSLYTPNVPHCCASFSDAYQTMKLVDACIQSSQTGKWVEVSEKE